MANKIYIGFPQTSLNDLIELIKNASTPFAPIYFSWGERVSNKLDIISDRDRFAEFYKKASQHAFSLIGNKITYHLTSNNFSKDGNIKTHGNLFVEFKRGFKSKEGIIPLLTNLMEASGIQFGYACDFDEWFSRHRVIKKWENPKNHAGVSSVEYTIGVNFLKYIPSLYWYTVLENKYLEQHNLDPSLIKNISVHYSEFETQDGRLLFCFQLFKKSKLWRDHASAIEEFCSNNPQFFSLKNLSERIKKAQSAEDLDETIAYYDR